MKDIRKFLHDADTRDLNTVLQNIDNLWYGAPKHWGEDPNKRNNTLNFFNADEEEEFKKDENNKYKNYKISYILNEDGYRSSVLRENNFYCFGCCNTLGWGLPAEKLWSHKLFEKIGTLGYRNFGTLAGINDNIARTSYQAINFLPTPSAVFVLFTPSPAIEFFSQGGKSINFIPGASRMRHLSEFGNHYFNFESVSHEYKSYLGLMNKVNCFFNFVKNYKLVELSCKDKNIPFFWHTHCKDVLNISHDLLSKYVDINKAITKNGKLLDLNVNPGELSRDKNHFGETFHDLLAEGFYKLYKGS